MDDEKDYSGPPKPLDLQLDSTWKDAGQAMEYAMSEINQDRMHCLEKQPKNQEHGTSSNKCIGDEYRSSILLDSDVLSPPIPYEEDCLQEVCTSELFKYITRGV